MPDKREPTPTLDELVALFDIPPVGILPESHEAYALIGRVAAEWANLEHVLDSIIWELAGDDRRQIACITGQIMGGVPRLKAIIALLTLRRSESSKSKLADKLVSKFHTLMQKVHEPAERRNRIVHDAWYTKGRAEQPAQFRSMPFKDMHYGVQDVDLDEVRGVIASINKLTSTARKLSVEVERARVTWREIMPPPSLSGLTRKGLLSGTDKDT